VGTEKPLPDSEKDLELTDTIVVTGPPAVPDLSSSQESGFEIVDPKGIDKEIEKASTAAGVKKRAKKGKK